MHSDRRPHRLYIVFAQPAIPNLVGARMPGELELHQNGFVILAIEISIYFSAT